MSLTSQTPASSQIREPALSVHLAEKSYPIWIGTGLLSHAATLFKTYLPQSDVIILTDENLSKTHLPTLRQALEKANISVRQYILPPGEPTKSFSHLEDTLNSLLTSGIERKTSLIALGGGVIGDFTGLCAALLLRGIPFFQIPTSLLAQVDSSVGGKTAINTSAGKNLIGAFYQPRAVLIDTDCLKTLPSRDLLSGYAEILKYALLGNENFFQWLTANAPALLAGDATLQTEAIRVSCQMKADIVSEDETEKGKRALLNLGHTFGHALEAESGYQDCLTHGEGVAIGMMMAFEFSHALGLCPEEDVIALRSHLRQVGLPTYALAWCSVADQHKKTASQWADAFITHMSKDKKVADGKLTFILVHGIGQSFITQDVAITDLKHYLETHLISVPDDT